MIRTLIKYTVMFVALVLVQVLILNQVQFSGFVNPYIYVLFILLLPLSAPRYVVMLLAFFLGLTIDVFANSLGIHAAASVFIAYARPLVIRIISNREEDRSDYPGLFQTKFSWFVSYASIMVLLHHLVFFYLEVFSLNHFGSTMLRVVISAAFSVFVIVVSQFIVFRN